MVEKVVKYVTKINYWFRREFWLDILNDTKQELFLYYSSTSYQNVNYLRSKFNYYLFVELH